EQHIDSVMLDELGGLGGGDAVDGGPIFEEELELPAEQAATRVDVIDQHLRHVRIGYAHGRKRPRLLGNNSYLDGWIGHGLSPVRSLESWKAPSDVLHRSAGRTHGDGQSGQATA